MRAKFLSSDMMSSFPSIICRRDNPLSSVAFLVPPMSVLFVQACDIQRFLYFHVNFMLNFYSLKNLIDILIGISHNL